MTAPNGEALAARLALMMGESAGIGWSPCKGEAGLLAGEADHLARAVPKRRAEFAAGRRAARMALEGLGHAAQAIPVGTGRAPAWPEGIQGSITHDRGVALAAVVAGGAGIGIDLTEAADLPGDTRRVILPHDEEGGLSDLEARAGFSAKESLFKALFPCVETHFGFDAAVVWPDLDAGHFTVRLTGPLGPYEAGRVFGGHVAVIDGVLLTALRIAS